MAKKSHKIIISLFLVVLSVFTGVWIHFNQITEWNKKYINNGELKPLTCLEEINKDKFDLMVLNLSRKENARNYYYETTVIVKSGEAATRVMRYDEYEYNKNLPGMKI